MNVWQITRKDLVLLFRDSRAIFVLVALPLMFIAIIGTTSKKLLSLKDGRRYEIEMVLPDDHIETSTEESIVSWKPTNRQLKIAIGNRLQKIEGIAVRWRRGGEPIETTEKSAAVISAKLVIDTEIATTLESLVAENLFSEKSPSLSELGMKLDFRDPSSPAEKALLEKIVVGEMIQVISPIVLSENSETQNAKLKQAWMIQNTEPQEDLSNSKPTRKSVYQFVVPAYSVMFAFFLINIMARSLLHERELGTLQRLRVAPISQVELLLGKTLPFLIVSLLQSTILFLFGYFVFGMSFGNSPWMIMPVLLATSIAATALGLLVATLVRTESQVSAFANLAVLGMAGISGCFLPRDWLPESLQSISRITPHAWSLIS